MEFESVTLRFEKVVALNSEGRINGALMQSGKSSQRSRPGAATTLSRKPGLQQSPVPQKPTECRTLVRRCSHEIARGTRGEEISRYSGSISPLPHWHGFFLMYLSRQTTGSEFKRLCPPKKRFRSNIVARVIENVTRGTLEVFVHEAVLTRVSLLCTFSAPDLVRGYVNRIRRPTAALHIPNGVCL